MGIICVLIFGGINTHWKICSQWLELVSALKTEGGGKAAMHVQKHRTRQVYGEGVSAHHEAGSMENK